MFPGLRADLGHLPEREREHELSTWTCTYSVLLTTSSLFPYY